MLALDLKSYLDFKSHQLDIYKIYLYGKDPYEAKYQMLIYKHESVPLRHYNAPKTFIEYSNDIKDVHRNIDGYNQRRKQEILIVLDMIDG